MRKYFDEDELLEAKADEKPITFLVVYRTWNEKNFNHIPSDGLVMSIIPTSYKTLKLAIKNKEKFATVPFIANSLDKIEIYEISDDLTMGDWKSMKHYERESFLAKCKLVHEENLRKKNEEYERGYRAGRREALRSLDEELSDGQKAEIERAKAKKQYRKDARNFISAITSDLDKIEQSLRYYSRNSDSDFELWKHAKNAQNEINQLRDKLDKWGLKD